MEKLLGKVPFLNGGVFEEHDLEKRNPDIDIPDKAFEKLFDFFDDFRWHLDERPLRADNEINPGVIWCGGQTDFGALSFRTGRVGFSARVRRFVQD